MIRDKDRSFSRGPKRFAFYGVDIPTVDDIFEFSRYAWGAPGCYGARSLRVLLDGVRAEEPGPQIAEPRPRPRLTPQQARERVQQLRWERGIYEVEEAQRRERERRDQDVRRLVWEAGHYYAGGPFRDWYRYRPASWKVPSPSQRGERVRALVRRVDLACELFGPTSADTLQLHRYLWERLGIDVETEEGVARVHALLDEVFGPGVGRVRSD